MLSSTLILYSVINLSKAFCVSLVAENQNSITCHLGREKTFQIPLDAGTRNVDTVYDFLTKYNGELVSNCGITKYDVMLLGVRPFEVKHIKECGKLGSFLPEELRKTVVNFAYGSYDNVKYFSLADNMPREVVLTKRNLSEEDRGTIEALDRDSDDDSDPESIPLFDGRDDLYLSTLTNRDITLARMVAGHHEIRPCVINEKFVDDCDVVFGTLKNGNHDIEKVSKRLLKDRRILLAALYTKKVYDSHSLDFTFNALKNLDRG